MQWAQTWTATLSPRRNSGERCEQARGHDPTWGSRMNKKALLIVGLMLFFAAAYFYQDPEWNGNSRLNLTRAIVERGTLRVDAYQNAPGWATEDSAYYNGHYYSDKA